MRTRPTIRRTTLILTSVMVGLVGPAVLASPANAVPELHKDEYYQGSYLHDFLNNYDYDGDTFNDGAQLNDEVTSIYNAVSGFTCYSTDAAYKGNTLLLGPWDSQVNIGSIYSDKLSSHDFDCDGS